MACIAAIAISQGDSPALRTAGTLSPKLRDPFHSFTLVGLRRPVQTPLSMWRANHTRVARRYGHPARHAYTGSRRAPRDRLAGGVNTPINKHGAERADTNGNG